jgi:hypothetical protein
MGDAAKERRLRMPDGEWWTAEQRHEMTQLATRASQRERRLFVFFRSEGGALRRAEVPADFSVWAGEEVLHALWERAERLTGE